MNGTQQQIHAKIVELASELGRDARKLGWDDEIPASRVLDSPALMELIIWYETTFSIEIDQDQLTIDNFGTINAMAAYLEELHK
jgi:acyl carrier protein